MPASLLQLQQTTKISSLELAGRDHQRATSLSSILLKVLLMLKVRLLKHPLASSPSTALLTVDSFLYQPLTKMVKTHGSGMVIVSKSTSLQLSNQVTHSGGLEQFIMATIMMPGANFPLFPSPFMPIMNMTGQTMEVQTGSPSITTMALGMTFS